MNPGDTVRIYHPGHEHHGKVGEFQYFIDREAIVKFTAPSFTTTTAFLPWDVQPAEDPA
jgi:hypothetical protein